MPAYAPLKIEMTSAALRVGGVGALDVGWANAPTTPIIKPKINVATCFMDRTWKSGRGYYRNVTATWAKKE
jgi:hypothetical protein